MARTHVILADEVIEAIDRRVGARGRSRFLEEAAREKLERSELADALVAATGIMSSEDYPEFRDRESIAQWVRRQRGHDEPS
jgi:hypothetical protein